MSKIKCYVDNKIGTEMYILPHMVLFGEILPHDKGGNAYRIGLFHGETTVRRYYGNKGKETLSANGEVVEWLDYDFASKKRDIIDRVLNRYCIDPEVVISGEFV